MLMAQFQHLWNDSYALQIGTDTVTGQHRVILTRPNDRPAIQRFTNKNLELAQEHFDKLKTLYHLA